MAKTQSDLTPAQKATIAAREKLDAANKTNDAAKIKSAREHLAECLKTENRERFVRVGGGRVRKIRTAIRGLSNVASPRSYHYTEDDVAKAESVLNAELKSAFSKLRNALTKGGTAKAEDDFSFG